MVPRLIFQEWQGWEGWEDLAGEMSRSWPYWTGWTLGEVRTAAWLVTNLNLTLGRLTFPTDLNTMIIVCLVIVRWTNSGAAGGEEHYDDIPELPYTVPLHTSTDNSSTLQCSLRPTLLGL